MKYIILILIVSLHLHAWAQESEMERAMGAHQFEIIKNTQGFYHDEDLLRMVSKVGHQLEKHLEDSTFKFDYYIIDTPTPNAFATSGGYVYVTRGLLALLHNEDELACALGHEISHVTLHHTKKRLHRNILPAVIELPGNLIGKLWVEEAGDIINFPVEFFSKTVNSSFDRKQEKQADDHGIQLASRAGYNPKAFMSLLEKLQKEVDLLSGEKAKKGIFNDHPMTDERVRWIDEAIAKMNTSFHEPQSVVALLDGLVIGQNAEQGVISADNAFYHPGLDIFLQLPKGWLAENTAASLTAIDPQAKAVLVMGMEDQAKSIEDAVTTYLKKVQQDKNLSLNKLDSIPINMYKSREAVVIQKKGKKEIVSLMVWIQLRQSDQILQMAGSTNTEAGFDQIVSAMSSIRPLLSEEKSHIREQVIKVEKGHNESLAQFAERKDNTDYLPFLEVLNDIDKSQNIENQNIKYIEVVLYHAH